MKGRKLFGRCVVATVLVAAAVVGMVISLTATAVPANAAGGGDCETLAGHYQVAGSYILASRWRICGLNEIPLAVTIKRYLSPGVWETVASGTGDIIYYCDGFAYNVYQTTGTPEFAILCG